MFQAVSNYTKATQPNSNANFTTRPRPKRRVNSRPNGASNTKNRCHRTSKFCPEMFWKSKKRASRIQAHTVAQPRLDMKSFMRTCKWGFYPEFESTFSMISRWFWVLPNHRRGWLASGQKSSLSVWVERPEMISLRRSRGLRSKALDLIDRFVFRASFYSASF